MPVTPLERTILFVDAFAPMRNVLTLIASERGYLTLTAQSATEALEVAKQAAKVDLLITEVTLPDMPGLELIELFRFIHPKAGAAFVSSNWLPLEAVGRFGYLPKPFTADQLYAFIEAILKNASPARAGEISSFDSQTY